MRRTTLLAGLLAAAAVPCAADVSRYLDSCERFAPIVHGFHAAPLWYRRKFKANARKGL
jgi:hypothetical protein